MDLGLLSTLAVIHFNLKYGLSVNVESDKVHKYQGKVSILCSDGPQSSEWAPVSTVQPY